MQSVHFQHQRPVVWIPFLSNICLLCWGMKIGKNRPVLYVQPWSKCLNWNCLFRRLNLGLTWKSLAITTLKVSSFQWYFWLLLMTSSRCRRRMCFSKADSMWWLKLQYLQENRLHLSGHLYFEILNLIKCFFKLNVLRGIIWEYLKYKLNKKYFDRMFNFLIT